MDDMEAIMAGLFSRGMAPAAGAGASAPAAEDPFRNRFAGGSIGGPNLFVQRLLPYLLGTPGLLKFPNKGGPPGGIMPQPQGVGGGHGLSSLLNGVGGPNVAPGNLQTGMANPNPQLSGPGEGSFEGGYQGTGGPGGGIPYGSYVGQTKPKTTLPGLQAQFGGKF